MKDRFGNELSVGDTVIYCHMVSRSSAGMSLEKIHSFTPKMVRLGRFNDRWNSNRVTVNPGSLARYNKEDRG